MNETVLVTGVDAAYYLIHSMRVGADFHYRDLLAAHRFGIAAREAGLQRMPVTFVPRHSADDVRVGDALDYWRVEAVERDRFLLLRAEIKVPGRAWLQFKAVPIDGGGSQLLQAAFFAPKGLFGLLYWYALYPIHSLIFSGLIRKLAQRADVLHNTSSPPEDAKKQVSGKDV